LKLRIEWILAALMILVLASYWTSLGGDFVYDDQDLIFNNAVLQKCMAGIRDDRGGPLGRVGSMLTADFAQIGNESENTSGLAKINYWRPVIAATYILDALVWGVAEKDATGRVTWVHLNPVGFHVTNLLFHALNVLLVFLLARALLRNRVAGALVAALFAVHPIHTESVSWIAGRTDVIAATFFLAAFWAYLRFRRRGSRLAYWISVGLLLVGVFAKEMVASLGFLLILYEVLNQLYGRTGHRGRLRPSMGIRLVQVLPFFLVIVPYFLLKDMLSGSGTPMDNWKDVDHITRIASFFVAGAWYMGKVLWPCPLDIYPILPFAALGTGILFLCLHLAVAGAAIGLTWRFRASVAAFSALGFYLSLAPLSSIVKGTLLLRFSEDVDFPVSERFLYIPSLFLLLGVGWVLWKAGERRGRAGRAVAGCVAGLLILACGAATAVRGLDWRNNLELYTAAVKTAPQSVRMQSNLGLELLGVFRIEEAKSELFECLRLQEELYSRQKIMRGVDPFAYQHLGRCYLMEGDIDRAVNYYRNGMLQYPDLLPSANNFGFVATVVAALKKNTQLAGEGYGAYMRVLEQDPNNELALERINFLKNVVAAWGFYFEKGMRTDRACSLLARSYQIIARNCREVSDDPRPVQTLEILRIAVAALPPVDAEKMPTTAEDMKGMEALYKDTVTFGRDYYDKLLERWPDRPHLYFLRGEVERLAYERSRDPAERDKAKHQYRRALEMSPHLTIAALPLATLLRREGREEEALRVVDASASACVRAGKKFWHEVALQLAARAYEGAGRGAAWRGLLGRVLASIAGKLGATAGNSGQAWNDLGFIHDQAARFLGDRRRFEDALKCFQRALKLDPLLVNAAGGWVVALRNLGRSEEAEARRVEFRQRFPRHPFFK